MMTKRQALAKFRENTLPLIREAYEKDRRVDHVARREGWNNYVDSLRSDKIITKHQYETWGNPF